MTGTQIEMVRGSVYIGLILIAGAAFGFTFMNKGVKKANTYTDKAIEKHYYKSDSIMHNKIDSILYYVKQ